LDQIYHYCKLAAEGDSKEKWIEIRVNTPVAKELLLSLQDSFSKGDYHDFTCPYDQESLLGYLNRTTPPIPWVVSQKKRGDSYIWFGVRFSKENSYHYYYFVVDNLILGKLVRTKTGLEPVMPDSVITD
jgi:hypothetical protein